MSYYDGDIPGDSEFKSCVAEGLIEAEFSTEEHFLQYETSCGKDQYVWNPRYEKIISLLSKERYCAKVFKKNRWPYMAILDMQDNCLFILLNKNRLRDLINHPTRSQKHYAKSPAIRNSDLDQFDTLHEHMLLAGWNDNELDEGVMDFRHDELLKLENAFGKRFERYVIITFRPDKELGIGSLTANLVDSKFQLKKSEPWDGYITIMRPIEPKPDGTPTATNGAIVLSHDNSVDSKPKPKIISFPKQENE